MSLLLRGLGVVGLLQRVLYRVCDAETATAAADDDDTVITVV